MYMENFSEYLNGSQWHMSLWYIPRTHFLFYFCHHMKCGKDIKTPFCARCEFPGLTLNHRVVLSLSTHIITGMKATPHRFLLHVFCYMQTMLSTFMVISALVMIRKLTTSNKVDDGKARTVKRPKPLSTSGPSGLSVLYMITLVYWWSW